MNVLFYFVEKQIGADVAEKSNSGERVHRSEGYKVKTFDIPDSGIRTPIGSERLEHVVVQAFNYSSAQQPYHRPASGLSFRTLEEDRRARTERAPLLAAITMNEVGRIKRLSEPGSSWPPIAVDEAADLNRATGFAWLDRFSIDNSEFRIVVRAVPPSGEEGNPDTAVLVTTEALFLAAGQKLKDNGVAPDAAIFTDSTGAEQDIFLAARGFRQELDMAPSTPNTEGFVFPSLNTLSPTVEMSAIDPDTPQDPLSVATARFAGQLELLID